MILISQLRNLNLPVVMVSTKTGQSIKGALVDRTRDALVIRAAAVASVDGNGNVKWHSLDGDVHVPMDNVDFYQMGLPTDMLDTLADREAARSR